MANDNHLSSVTCYNVTMLSNNYYNDFLNWGNRKIDDKVDFDEAAMAEPLACAVHGMDKLNIQTGQVVLVIGGGTIGLLMVQLAKLSGASTIILSEPI